MVFSEQRAFRQLLALWRVFQRGESFGRGLTKWRDVFALLRDIRPWGVKDRLEETGVLSDWSERAAANEEVVPCEIELWFRASEELRGHASDVIRARVLEQGGEILAESVVAEIHYHALAVRLPIASVRLILDEEGRSSVRLVQSEQIQFFRASGQMVGRTPGERVPSAVTYDAAIPSGAPRVALFDGLPLQNHVSLVNRLSIDDPDEYSTDYHVAARDHGTGMASLIVWGDLNGVVASAIPTPLYVRPIMRPVSFPAWTQRPPEERMPDDSLAVDVVERAVRRMLEPGGVAPTVALINFSLGIADRPFVRFLSPLAKLFDFLSWKYGVLFVVSAGNHGRGLDVGLPWSQVNSLSSTDFAGLVVRSLTNDARNRRALSPAESMNSLTVGAMHSDLDTAVHPPTRLNPLPNEYPSSYSAQGHGYRRSIKPDVLMPGGRSQFDRPYLGTDTFLRPGHSGGSPGHKVASPGALAGDVTHTTKSRGTSNAAALLSRRGAFLAQEVEALRQTPNGTALGGVSDALLLKALLAHGARWGDVGEAMRAHFDSAVGDKVVTEQLTRALGFGGIQSFDVAEGSSSRVTALGAGRLDVDAGAEHRFPLPPSLSSKRGLRRVTVTLAWFTPTNPLSHKWRQAHLWFETPKSRLKLERNGPDFRAVQRGTLQHESFEGESASAVIDGDDIVIKVSCREDAPGLRSAIPYAIAVTLEVAESLGIDIYTEVRDRVRQRIQAQAAL